MKSFAVVLALGLAVAVHAQEQCDAIAAKVPTCAVSCISSAASGVGCGADDFSCQCKPANDAAINSAALECVVKGCGAVTGLAVQQAASSICACVASAPASTPAKATTSAAAIMATSSPVAVVTSSAAAAPATTATTMPSTTSTTVTPTTTAPSSTTAISASSSPMSFTGGAVKVVASVGGVLGALVAIMAAL